MKCNNLTILCGALLGAVLAAPAATACDLKVENAWIRTPPPGVPGVETMLPLLLTAVHAGRLTLDDILLRCVENPRRIYGLPTQPDTFVDVDVDARYELIDARQHTKAGWTPFDGMSVFGRVERVTLRGRTVYDGERVLAEPGSGEVLFQWV